MRKWLKIIPILLLLTGGVVVCIVRWQAWFGMPAEPVWTGETLDYTFINPGMDSTAMQHINADSTLTILVLGDIHNKLQRDDYDTLAARVPQANMIAQAGDWIDRGQNYYYQLLLREWCASALDSMPVISCPGNHEYNKGLEKTVSTIWVKAFPHPRNGPNDVPGESYFVDLPQLRFICIDTNPMVRMVNITRTLNWLHRTMDDAKGKFIVIMMHHPILSVGKGRFNSLIYAAFRRVSNQADLVIAGHDHSYMRYRNLVVINAAGRPKPQKMHVTPDKIDPEPTYSVITLRDSLRRFEFKTYHLSDGEAIDSLYVVHE